MLDTVAPKNKLPIQALLDHHVIRVSPRDRLRREGDELYRLCDSHVRFLVVVVS